MKEVQRYRLVEKETWNHIRSRGWIKLLHWISPANVDQLVQLDDLDFFQIKIILQEWWAWPKAIINLRKLKVVHVSKTTLAPRINFTAALTNIVTALRWDKATKDTAEPKVKTSLVHGVMKIEKVAWTWCQRLYRLIRIHLMLFRSKIRTCQGIKKLIYQCLIHCNWKKLIKTRI